MDVSMEPVVSSNIDSVGYDAGTFMLYVKFKGGRVYVYENVPDFVYRDLMNAESKGSFLARHIKNVYNCKPLL